MYVGHSTATVHFPQLFYRVEIVPFESFTATCLLLGWSCSTLFWTEQAFSATRSSIHLERRCLTTARRYPGPN
jgi:hypothetical protein